MDNKKNTNLKGKIAGILSDVFKSTDKVNLKFIDFTDPSKKPAESPLPTVTNGVYSETIKVNLVIALGASQEFDATIMMHEVLHYYINYNNQYFMLKFQQHQEMANKYVDDMKSFLQQLVPSLNDNDTYCLILNRMSDVLGTDLPTYYATLRSKYGVTDNSAYLFYRLGVHGTVRPN